MTTNDVTILIKKEKTKNLVNLACLINKLTPKEQERMFVFMQGVLFAKDYQEEKEIAHIVEQIS